MSLNIPSEQDVMLADEDEVWNKEAAGNFHTVVQFGTARLSHGL